MPFRDAIIDVLVTTAVGAVERGVPREELARTLREALEAAPPEMPALSDEARAREIVDRFWPTSDGPFVRVNDKPRDLERLVSEIAAALGAARDRAPAEIPGEAMDTLRALVEWFDSKYVQGTWHTMAALTASGHYMALEVPREFAESARELWRKAHDVVERGSTPEAKTGPLDREEVARVVHRSHCVHGCAPDDYSAFDLKVADALLAHLAGAPETKCPHGWRLSVCRFCGDLP